MTISPRQLLPVALIVAATFVAWLAAPTPARTKPAAAALEDWETPKIQARDPARWIASIKQHKLWGAAEKSSDADAAHPGASVKPRWNLVGVAFQGGSPLAYISVGDKPSEPYRVGDQTPDGAKILKIEDDRLHLLANGKESILKIYRQ